MKKYIKIDKILLLITYLYLALPVSIQLFFWFNKLISIPLIILLYVGLYFTMKKFKPLENEEYKKVFNIKRLIIIGVLVVFVNLLSGAGSISYQNWDYNGRNAILHDLIDHDWPVKYDYTNLEYENEIIGNTGMLSYYFAYWLPGALVGKVTNFKVATIFMFFWQLIGISLFFYFVFRKMKNVKYRYFIIFLMFSGLNVIGQYVMNIIYDMDVQILGVAHVDTSIAPFCMSSFITQWFWVFNQSIPAWIITMLFLQNKEYKTCGYQFALLVPYAPFPMIGFLYLVFVFIIFGKELNKFINFKRIKELCSIPNFFGVISILPIIYMFSLNESEKGSVIVRELSNGNNIWELLLVYLIYLILEFGVYSIVIHKKNYKNVIVCFLSFAVLPLFYIGTGCDLGNRCTIPMLVFFYILVIKYLDDYKFENIKQNLLIVFLALGSLTNVNEFYRALKYSNYKHFGFNIADNYKTFDTFEGKECSTFIKNFVNYYDENDKTLTFIMRQDDEK